MKKYLPFLFSLFFCPCIWGQNMVAIELQETLSKEELAGLFFGFPVNNGIEAFKVLYETTDTDGSIDTVSGLMVLPLNEAQDPNLQFPYLAYQHGTVSERDQVPSNPEVFERRLVYYFAGQGYIGTAADYLGLGESKRIIHPYIHAGTEASAAIDLVKVAKSYVDSQADIITNDQLFITGYSQGGHAGMAMHKALNDNPIEGLEVAAGSHMSGIYNVSGELVKGAIGEAVYQFPSYVVWIMVGYQSVYGNLYNDLSEIFRPDYIESISGFVNGTITRGDLNGILIDLLVQNHEASIPRFLFTESYIDAFENEPNSPVRIAMEDNDLFNWVPKSPMRMMYCMADDQVAFTNSTFTDSIMNRNGAADVAAVDVNSEADHGGCVIPASFATITFFEQFANRSIISSTINIDPNLQFQVSPNPAREYITLKINKLGAHPKNYQLRLMNLSGQTILTKTTANLENFHFPLNEIPSGLYLMQIQTNNGFWTEKLFKRY